MQFIIYLSQYIIPFMIFYIVGYGLMKNVSVYDSFVAGAKDGIRTVVKIVPALIGLMTATGVLRASGFLDFLASLMSQGMWQIKDIFPPALIPLSIIRMFSSRAATGLLLDLYKEYGTDSRVGLISSLMMSSTETVFYTISVYFMTVEIKKTRYTLAGALLATLAGLAASIVLAGFVGG